MSDTTTKKPRRKMTSLELSTPTRGALRRLKQKQGMSFTVAIEKGVIALETKLNAQTI